MKDGFDFFNEDKHQRFVQVDTIVFGGYSQTCPKYFFPKMTAQRVDHFLIKRKFDIIISSESYNSYYFLAPSFFKEERTKKHDLSYKSETGETGKLIQRKLGKVV